MDIDKTRIIVRSLLAGMAWPLNAEEESITVVAWADHQDEMNQRFAAWLNR